MFRKITRLSALLFLAAPMLFNIGVPRARSTPHKALSTPAASAAGDSVQTDAYTVSSPAVAAQPTTPRGVIPGQCPDSTSGLRLTPKEWIGDIVTPTMWTSWLIQEGANVYENESFNNGNNETICFRPGTYTLIDTWPIYGRSNLNIVGNGAILRQADTCAGGPGPSSTAQPGCLFSNSHILIGDSERVEISGFVIRGTYNGGAYESFAPQKMAGLEVTSNSHDVIFHDNTTIGTWGDGFEVNGQNVDNNLPPERVVIRNNESRQAGRQGISVVHGSDVLITQNRVYDPNLIGIDVEPSPGLKALERIQIDHNTIFNGGDASGGMPARSTQISIQSKPGSTIRDISIDSNTVGGPLHINVGDPLWWASDLVRGPDGIPKEVRYLSRPIERVSITDNAGEYGAMDPLLVPPIRAKHVAWLTASGNNNGTRQYDDKYNKVTNTCLARIDAGDTSPTAAGVTVPGGLSIENFIEMAFVRSICRTPDLTNADEASFVFSVFLQLESGAMAPEHLLASMFLSDEAMHGSQECVQNSPHTCSTGMLAFSRHFVALTGRVPGPIDFIPILISESERGCPPVEMQHITERLDLMFGYYNADSSYSAKMDDNCMSWSSASLSEADFRAKIAHNLSFDVMPSTWPTGSVSTWSERVDFVDEVAGLPDVAEKLDARLLANQVMVGLFGRPVAHDELEIGEALFKSQGTDLSVDELEDIIALAITNGAFAA